MTHSLDKITIRTGHAGEPALRDLAQLDSAKAPAGDLLVAVIDGEPRVAVSLEDGSAIADPFMRTVELVELLRAHATRLDARAGRRPALATRLRHALAA